MKKFEPRTYQLDIKKIGDHLRVFIPELGITVETEPGKTSHADALDAAHLAIEKSVMAEQEAIKTAQ
jgi:hypothetical protein